MPEEAKYTFTIHDCTPHSTSMLRVGKYIESFARLLGHTENVHILPIEGGSIKIAAKVDHSAAPQVKNRLQSINKGNPPDDAVPPLNEMQRLLRGDNSSGSLQAVRGDSHTNILIFPMADSSTDIYTVKEVSEVVGELVRIGGKQKDHVPVHLKDGETVHMCEADRSMARSMASYLYGPVLRAQGEGRWKRDPIGWSLDRFRISSFETLSDEPLDAVVRKLQTAEGNGWMEVEDPINEVLRLRNAD